MNLSELHVLAAQTARQEILFGCLSLNTTSHVKSNKGQNPEALSFPPKVKKSVRLPQKLAQRHAQPPRQAQRLRMDKRTPEARCVELVGRGRTVQETECDELLDLSTAIFICQISFRA